MTPSQVTVRMYNVGFGDSFLCTFDYPDDKKRSERHVLFDCGSTKAAKGRSMDDVVADIVRDTGGKLDVLVITHRHKDHVSAFGKASRGALLATLRPTTVLRPWVDDPKLPTDADSPNAAFASSVSVAQDFANAVASAIATTRGGNGGRRPELQAMAEDQIANARAIEAIDLLAEKRRGRYLRASVKPVTLAALPGVDIHVLGPPTIQQLPLVKTQAENYKDEYWFAQVSLLHDALGVAGLTSRNARFLARQALEERDANAVIGPAHWLIARLQERYDQTLARIVRSVDDVLNNTSLILLLEAGEKKLLFSGDAQGENWAWALEYADDATRPHYRELLEDVDLYKVGHHGSRNATPRSLYALWEDREREMVSLMSTLPGKHGSPTKGTEVPRKTLAAALSQLGPLFRSDGRAVASVAVTARLDRSAPFSLVRD
jgi:ribonuclease BN (tRNA processing enzyme)